MRAKKKERMCPKAQLPIRYLFYTFGLNDSTTKKTPLGGTVPERAQIDSRWIGCLAGLGKDGPVIRRAVSEVYSKVILDMTWLCISTALRKPCCTWALRSRGAIAVLREITSSLHK